MLRDYVRRYASAAELSNSAMHGARRDAAPHAAMTRYALRDIVRYAQRACEAPRLRKSVYVVYAMDGFCLLCRLPVFFQRLLPPTLTPLPDDYGAFRCHIAADIYVRHYSPRRHALPCLSPLPL